MKREDLKALGIADEQIDKIMSMHGKAIENEKAKTAKAVEDLKVSAADLEGLKGKLAELEKVNTENADLKSQLQKIQTDIAEKEKARKEQEELAQFHAEIETYTPDGLQYMNDYAKKGVAEAAIKLYRENPVKGLKACFESVVKDEKGNYNAGIFASNQKSISINPQINGSLPSADKIAQKEALDKAMGITHKEKD